MAVALCEARYENTIACNIHSAPSGRCIADGASVFLAYLDPFFSVSAPCDLTLESPHFKERSCTKTIFVNFAAMTVHDPGQTKKKKTTVHDRSRPVMTAPNNVHDPRTAPKNLWWFLNLSAEENLS